MPILINLNELLEKRQMPISELSEKLGIPIERINMLNAGGARALRLTTIDALCKILACEPGDLIQVVDDATYRKIFPAGPLYLKLDEDDKVETESVSIRQYIQNLIASTRKVLSKIRTVFKKITG